MENNGAEEARLKATSESEMPMMTGIILMSPQEKVEYYWASLKRKVRAAGDYATLRTRQGISLFGEPNTGPIKTIVDRC